ncbi:Mur ligase family protein [Calidifontibacillus oryziterrae]|uniref:Mur ligase family protein n=1 Tax=Calidifontibacillus oryziterrae TaxID=1191699 RepID=UPI0003160C39|nr:UDP-N-acetylmuramoyl-tripeptide--D-alanyl-D-alanine ligase [Calidifontibacillus oryziterrae]
MKAFTIREICQIIEGQLVQGSLDLVINYIPTYKEIRRNKKNVLIFLKYRKQFDWNSLKARLPCAIVIDKNEDYYQTMKDLTIIKVANVNQAYWTFVDYYRSLFDIPVVAVTGTCGKTTTKEMITHILKNTKHVQSTYSSANSRLAHLHYLIGIDETTEAAVFETAVGMPGDVTQACRFFKPTIGIITNIGACHLTGCKTIEGYIKAKGELVTSLENHGVLILNGDDEKTKTLSLDHFHGRILYFGIKNRADFKATNIEYGNGGMKFTLHLKNRSYPVFVGGYGDHQVYNALAALAATTEIGINIEDAAKRLQSFKNIVRHLEVSTGYNGATIIDDTWNFNTTSLEAGMKVLNHVANGGQRIALFSDMASLGDYEDELHKEAGSIIHKYGVDTIITIGNLAKEMAHYAASLGLNSKIYSFTNYDEIYKLLQKISNKNSTIYIKSFGNNLPMIELAAFFKKKVVNRGES